ncbi:hypothetical protein J6590_065342 [Homalodisca vitripennis]|nr:hypothetical protein J6590_065342 [Homalodisca vitripennis]
MCALRPLNQAVKRVFNDGCGRELFVRSAVAGARGSAGTEQKCCPRSVLGSCVTEVVWERIRVVRLVNFLCSDVQNAGSYTAKMNSSIARSDKEDDNLRHYWPVVAPNGRGSFTIHVPQNLIVPSSKTATKQVLSPTSDRLR